MSKDNAPVKKNLSSIQVMKTLQVLLQGNYTMAELIEKLNENEEEPIFNNSVVSKYINTCRYCGIEIPKIHNKYFVTNMPFGINLTNREFELLQNLQTFAEKAMSKTFNKSFKPFMEKIIRYSNKQIIKLDETSAGTAQKMFDKAIQEELKICLMFKTRSEIECIPIDTVKHKNKDYFHVYHNNKEKLIALDRLSGLSILAGKPIVQNDETVLYKITGDLAARYQIRDNESIVDEKEGEYKIIANKCRNIHSLISRLMRYDNLCEVLKPKAAREVMKNTLEDTLANYGE